VRRAATLLLALSAAACTPAPEEQVLTRFFEASRALDSTLLYRLATVVFNPRTDGSIQHFAITNLGPEQHGPLTAAQNEEARRSLAATTGQDPDLASLSIDLVTRELRVAADIRSPGGGTMPVTLVVSMARAVARRGDSTIEGQWIVTRLQRPRAERTSRGASSVPRS
jgi:hypothetical protein